MSSLAVIISADHLKTADMSFKCLTRRDMYNSKIHKLTLDRSLNPSPRQ